MNYREAAWDAFSRYIRLRDCLKTTGGFEWGRCYTCSAVRRFQELDAGHFVDGRTNALLFDEDGVRAQCIDCNRFHGGRKDLFRMHLLEDIGQEAIDRIQEQRYRSAAPDFVEIRQKYDEKSRNLISLQGRQ